MKFDYRIAFHIRGGSDSLTLEPDTDSRPVSRSLRAKIEAPSRIYSLSITIYALLLLSLVFVRSVPGQEPLMPEDPLKGRLVFEQKGCANCHSVSGTGGSIGPDLLQKKFYGTFLELASVMWNHAPEMLRRMRELELPFPSFTHGEMVDLIGFLYYLRYLGDPGDLYRGKILVREKGCLICHSIGGKGGEDAPAFDKLGKYVSPLYLAQALWNHGPEMDEKLSEVGLSRPRFEKGEIVDLSAYIRAATGGKKRERVYMAPGNPKRGRKVFVKSRCHDCHSTGEEAERIGPDLSSIGMGYSVTEIAGLMWNHGSAMGKLMDEKNIEWPMFTGKEMADLIAFLYFLKFEDKPGDPDRGGRVYQEKGCSACHGEDAEGTEAAPGLRGSEALSSTVGMARAMWNHAPLMEASVAEGAIGWPRVSGKEMADMYAYLKRTLEEGKRGKEK